MFHYHSLWKVSGRFFTYLEHHWKILFDYFERKAKIFFLFFNFFLLVCLFSMETLSNCFNLFSQGYVILPMCLVTEGTENHYTCSFHLHFSFMACIDVWLEKILSFCCVSRLWCHLDWKLECKVFWNFPPLHTV